MSPDLPRILDGVGRYYTGKLRAHGPGPQGVDWNSGESQRLRFDRLLEVCRDEPEPFLNDYGCGYGALVDHLAARGRPFRYRGFDIAPEMIEAARQAHRGLPHCEFVTDERSLEPADYTLASGLFNVRQDIAEQEWHDYIRVILGRIDAVSRRGFAFNVLSVYSDPERRRPDLYYADPLPLFDFCKRTFSPYVSLIHDYPLYEFTILVKRP